MENNLGENIFFFFNSSQSQSLQSFDSFTMTAFCNELCGKHSFLPWTQQKKLQRVTKDVPLSTCSNYWGSTSKLNEIISLEVISKSFISQGSHFQKNNVPFGNDWKAFPELSFPKNTMLPEFGNDWKWKFWKWFPVISKWNIIFLEMTSLGNETFGNYFQQHGIFSTAADI